MELRGFTKAKGRGWQYGNLLEGDPAELLQRQESQRSEEQILFSDEEEQDDQAEGGVVARGVVDSLFAASVMQIYWISQLYFALINI